MDIMELGDFMNINQLTTTFTKKRKNRELIPLMTTWGEKVLEDSRDPNYIPLPEYPRPQMQRESYLCLNGWWDYSISTGKEGKILVPFSPESKLSGVEHILMPNEVLKYRKSFTWDKKENKRVLLHIGACDQCASIFLNGEYLMFHEGGYLPFTVDLTDYIQKENVLEIQCTDGTDTNWYSRGKQKLSPKGMYYTSQSGIWQTVWIEEVPEKYIENIKITPLSDLKSVYIEVFPKDLPFTAQVADGLIQYSKSGVGSLCLNLMNPRCWSPEDPYLYDITIKTDQDRVTSCFGLRYCSVQKDEKGINRFFLNGKPYFLNGLLDQGYYPDGLYTAPNDEALQFDIKEMKKAGFNLLRKHCKLEPALWYYHCDKLGMLVWQDIVPGGEHWSDMAVTYLPTVLTGLQKREPSLKAVGRLNKQGRDFFEKEMEDAINALYSFPSIVTWVLFNEGWGQFDTKRLYEKMKKLDPNRPVDAASGWFDVGVSDYLSEHNYFRELKVHLDSKRAYILSEYGGVAYPVKDHVSLESNYGYGKVQAQEEFLSKFESLMHQIEKLKEEGLAGAIYTQVSDIEEETNGILTYDRKVNKLYDK